MTFEFFDLGDFTFASGVIVPNTGNSRIVPSAR